jgi:acetyl-CoA carboxylase biotin carboxyl carrier protein
MTDTTDTEVPDSVTLREVREIVRTFQESGWRSMTCELRGLRIVLGKDGRPGGTAAADPPGAGAGPAGDPAGGASAGSSSGIASAASAPPASSTPAEADPEGCVAVRSPAVGSFWVAPSPGQPPFVQVGDTVTEDQQLAIVEVMKLMNPVLAATAGEVVRVCAANAALVEYEQVLFWVRPR